MGSHKWDIIEEKTRENARKDQIFICIHKIIHYFISIFKTQNEGVLDAGALAAVVAVEVAAGVAVEEAAGVAVEVAAGVAAETSPSSPYASASASLNAFNSAFFSFFFSFFSSFFASFAFFLSAFFYFLSSLDALLSAFSVSSSPSPSFAALSTSSVSPSSYVAFPVKKNSSSSFPHLLIAESMHTQKDPVTGSLVTFYKNELYKALFVDYDPPSMNYINSLPCCYNLFTTRSI